METLKTNIPDWAKEINCAITVCDYQGVILYMNDKAKETFASYGDLVGKTLCGVTRSTPVRRFLNSWNQEGQTVIPSPRTLFAK